MLLIKLIENKSLLIKADKYQIENPYVTLMWDYTVLLFSDLSLLKNSFKIIIKTLVGNPE